MLREKKRFLEYPSKTVLEDLATRSGPPNKNSFTPFSGKRDVIEDQFRGKLREKFDLVQFLIDGASTELDFTKLVTYKVVDGVETNIVDRSFKVCEDFVQGGIESPEIKEWFKNVLIGYKRHNLSPIKGMNMKTYAAVTYGDDDDSEFDPRMQELIKSNYKVDIEEYDLAIRKLSFYIKAIWNHSIKIRSNLFSFIAAYADILKRKNYNQVNVRDFAGYRLYELNVHGDLVRCTDNSPRPYDHSNALKTQKYKDTIEIFTTYYDQDTLNMIKSFLDVCNDIGIDFSKQDPLKFTKESVSKIICTYVPNNTEYLKYYGEVDAEVMFALNNNLLSMTKSELYKDPNAGIQYNTDSNYEHDVMDRINVLYRTFRMSPCRELADLFGGSVDVAKNTLDEAFYILGAESDVSQFCDFSGLLVTMEGNPVVIEHAEKCFGKHRDYTESYNAFIMVNGSIILYSYDAEEISFLTAKDAADIVGGMFDDDVRWKDLWHIV